MGLRPRHVVHVGDCDRWRVQNETKKFKMRKNMVFMIQHSLSVTLEWRLLHHS